MISMAKSIKNVLNALLTNRPIEFNTVKAILFNISATEENRVYVAHLMACIFYASLRETTFDKKDNPVQLWNMVINAANIAVNNLYLPDRIISERDFMRVLQNMMKANKDDPVASKIFDSLQQTLVYNTINEERSKEQFREYFESRYVLTEKYRNKLRSVLNSKDADRQIQNNTSFVRFMLLRCLNTIEYLLKYTRRIRKQNRMILQHMQENKIPNIVAFLGANGKILEVPENLENLEEFGLATSAMLRNRDRVVDDLNEKLRIVSEKNPHKKVEYDSMVEKAYNHVIETLNSTYIAVQTEEQMTSSPPINVVCSMVKQALAHQLNEHKELLREAGKTPIPHSDHHMLH